MNTAKISNKVYLCIVAGLVSFVALCEAAPTPKEKLSGGTYTWKSYREVFEKKSANQGGLTIPYRLYRPRKIEGGKTYPLILMLHGAGAVGTDNEKNLSGGALGALNYLALRNLEAYILVPQSPYRSWSAKPEGQTPLSVVMQEIAGLIAKLPIDDTRLYVSGFSMGGHGTWVLYEQEYKTFAAFTPIAGAHMNLIGKAKKLKDVPVWIFHGSVDKQVKPVHSIQMAAALKKANSQSYQFTLFQGKGHGIAMDVYHDPDYWDWVFAQRK